MKKQALMLALAMLALCLSALRAFAADKPNILVIWGDDIGYWNLSHINCIANKTQEGTT